MVAGIRVVAGGGVRGGSMLVDLNETGWEEIPGTLLYTKTSISHPSGAVDPVIL